MKLISRGVLKIRTKGSVGIVVVDRRKAAAGRISGQLGGNLPNRTVHPVAVFRCRGGAPIDK